MYELQQIGERTYYIDCPAKVGIWLGEENRAVLIDGGSDKSAGKKILKILNERGWELRAIVNTHSHADHTGGNSFLQQQTGCAVFANGIETPLVNYPLLEPTILFGGYPIEELCHKFLLAEPSISRDVTDPEFPSGLEVIPLYGHAGNMIGLRTPDDVVFLADVLCSEATLEKYRITYLFDIAEHLKTLDRVEQLEAKLFVSAHAEPLEDVRELVEVNRRAVLEIGETLCGLLQEPLDFEEVLKRIFDRYGLVMNFQQYALVGSTVRSYLAWLKAEGRVAARIENNRLLWQAV